MQLGANPAIEHPNPPWLPKAQQDKIRNMDMLESLATTTRWCSQERTSYSLAVILTAPYTGHTASIVHLHQQRAPSAICVYIERSPVGRVSRTKQIPQKHITIRVRL